MKKVFIMPLMALIMTVMVSCNNDLDQHQLAIEHPMGSIHYADETADSIIFHTFDSYKIQSNADWIEVQGKLSNSIKYDYMKIYRIKNDVLLKPNTSGKLRIGTVQVDSYEYTTHAYYFQHGFLNIQHPEYKVEKYYENSTFPETVTFTLENKSDVVNDSIVFDVANNWSVEFVEGSDNSWLTFDKAQGFKGKNKVTLTLQPNSTDDARETKLVLTSGEVSNLVTVRQLSKKEASENAE